jgi:hypothetical protein
VVIIFSPRLASKLNHFEGLQNYGQQTTAKVGKDDDTKPTPTKKTFWVAMIWDGHKVRTAYDVGGVPMKSRFPISTPHWRMMS